MTAPDGAAPSDEEALSAQPDVDLKARRAWRIAGRGTLIVGGLLAATAAIGGGGGHLGAVYFLVGALIACLTGAMYAVYSAAIDSFRGRHVGRARVIAAVVLAALSLLLPVGMLGVAASAG